MKKALLSLAFGLFASIAINAQTKTWEFSSWTGITTGYSGVNVVDNLGIYANESGTAITNMLVVNTSNAAFNDSYSATRRGQLNGAGWSSGVTPNGQPTQRFLYFAVAGAGTLKVWFKTGSNGSLRTLYATDGTNVIASQASNNGGTDLGILTANYTNTSGNIFIAAGAAINIYKIEVTGPLGTTQPLSFLSTTDIKGKVNAQVFSSGKSVFLKDAKTQKAEVKVYSLNGALVKSLSTTTNTNFDLNQGLYLVTLKTAEGEKSVKVSVK